MEKFMIKYQIGYGLKILFVGINPHPGSYRRGVPYSNNKMFWYLLSDAGLIAEPRELLKDDVKLKHVYEKEFKSKYKFGLMGLALSPSPTVEGLDKAEIAPGRKRILDAIKKYEPHVVCFIAKITYSLFANSSTVLYGWQPNIGSSKIYVMHAPHRGFASVRIKELREVLKSAGK
jgi:double-stranded uracil-DNA glycosylase